MGYDQTSPDELRRLYLEGTLRQRYAIAIQRIDNPHLGPSLLVSVVSSLEGFARAVAMKVLVNNRVPLDQAYSRLWRLGPVEMISKHICPAYDVAPTDAFGVEVWSHLPEAIKFRNLLVHEAAYLHGGTCKRLIAASRHALDKLAELTGAV